MEEVQPLPEPVPPNRSATRFAVVALVLLAASLWADWWFLLRQPKRVPRPPLLPSEQGLQVDVQGLLVRARELAATGAAESEVDAAYGRVIDNAPTLIAPRLERMRILIERYLERSAMLEACPDVLPPHPESDALLMQLRTTMLSDAAVVSMPVSAHPLPPSDEEDSLAIEAFLTHRPVEPHRSAIAHCLAAWQEMAAGTLSLADEVIHEAAWKDAPGSLPAWIQSRMHKALKKPFADLLREMDALTAAAPKHAMYWVDRANWDPEAEEAEQALVTALDRAPGEPVILARLAEYEYKWTERHYAKALAWVEVATTHAPEAPGLYLLRARINEKLGRLVPARDDYDHARQLAMDRGDVRAARASFLLKIGQVDEALSEAQQAVHQDSSPETWSVLGEALIEHGEPEAALKQLEGHDGYPVQVTRCRALRVLGRYEEADAEALAANDATSRCLCFLAREHSVAAMMFFREAFFQYDAASCEAVARCYMVASDWEAALKFLDMEIEADPLRAEAFALRGQVFVEEMNWDAALAAFTQALSINPKNALALRGQGEALLAQGEVERAKGSLDQAVYRASKDPRGWNLRAEAKRRLHDAQGAIEDLTQSLKLDATQTEPLIQRGDLYAQANDLPKARADAEAAVKVLPKDPRAHTLLARVALAEGKPSEAEQSIAQALALAPRHSPALVARAQLALSRKDRTAARSDLDASLAIDADSAEALYLRAKLSVEDARWKEASRDLERLLLKHPDDAHATQARAWLDLARTGLKQR